MILDPKQTTVAYRCPKCGAVVRGAVGMFSLTADMLRLKCPCGGSALEITYTKDKKVRLTVPCFVCPAPHTYLVSSNVFFKNEIFTLACTYSGIDICFIGSEGAIDTAVAENEAELAELAGENGIELLVGARDNLERDDDIPDPQVIDVLRYVLSELVDEGNIHCRCDDGGDYELQFGDGRVYIVCKKCGAELSIPSGSIYAAYAFLNADYVTLV